MLGNVKDFPKYPCSQKGCEKIFPSSDGMEVRLKTHDSSSEYLICLICFLESVSEEEYFKHIGSTHGQFPLAKDYKWDFKEEDTRMKEYFHKLGETYKPQR